jgi:hypothetical protein
MYSELDTITMIMQWQATIRRDIPKLCADKVLDVWKYSLALRSASTSANCPLDTWGKMGLTNSASLHERVNLLARLKNKCINTYQLISAHPVLHTFGGFALRVRFIKGFAPEAFDKLRVDVLERMAKAVI